MDVYSDNGSNDLEIARRRLNSPKSVTFENTANVIVRRDRNQCSRWRICEPVYDAQTTHGTLASISPQAVPTIVASSVGLILTQRRTSRHTVLVGRLTARFSNVSSHHLQADLPQETVRLGDVFGWCNASCRLVRWNLIFPCCRSATNRTGILYSTGYLGVAPSEFTPTFTIGRPSDAL